MEEIEMPLIFEKDKARKKLQEKNCPEELIEEILKMEWKNLKLKQKNEALNRMVHPAKQYCSHTCQFIIIAIFIITLFAVNFFLGILYENIIAYSISYTFLIVGFYESLDILSIFKNIKEDVNAKFGIGLFTLLGSVVSLIIGYTVLDDTFYKNLVLSIAGNLIGYAIVLICVVKMKELLQIMNDEKIIKQNE